MREIDLTLQQYRDVTTILAMIIAQINETYIGKLTFIVGFMKVVTRHTQELHENASQ